LEAGVACGCDAFVAESKGNASSPVLKLKTVWRWEKATGRRRYGWPPKFGFENLHHPRNLSAQFMSNVPANLKYTKSHEWVRVSGDTAVVGITDHAQHELTDIVFVELPDAGRKVKAGEACAVVESVKTASDIYSPLSGEILEVNKSVVDDPALVNSEPHAGGWFFKNKFSNPAELNALLSPEQYKKQIGG
jgi:glycine cleavage system H protein